MTAATGAVPPTDHLCPSARRRLLQRPAAAAEAAAPRPCWRPPTALLASLTRTPPSQLLRSSAAAPAASTAANPCTWEPNGTTCAAATATASTGSLSRAATGGLAAAAPTQSSGALVTGPCKQVHDGLDTSSCPLECADSLDRLLEYLDGTGEGPAPGFGAAAAEGPSMPPAEEAAL